MFIVVGALKIIDRRFMHGILDTMWNAMPKLTNKSFPRIIVTIIAK